MTGPGLREAARLALWWACWAEREGDEAGARALQLLARTVLAQADREEPTLPDGWVRCEGCGVATLQQGVDFDTLPPGR